jgi:dipeptidyl aminopeptidase/acylaminoacyl peptidase
MKKVMFILACIAVGIMIFVTLVIKNMSRSPLLGPDITELNFTDVVFPSGQLTLAGMLFIPEGQGPFPAVVMIHGSGISQRNDPWYLTVVQRLQEHGVAVLLPDKRGSEKSQGDWTKTGFHDLAVDVTAAMDYIRSQSIFPCGRIGVMGFSQGGWIAPIVADQDEDVAFVVTMSGADVTTDEQLLFSETNSLTDIVLLRFLAERLAPLTAEIVRRTDFWKIIGGFDPIPYWKDVAVPAFLAFGENDRNVPVEESVARIRALGKDNLLTRIYPAGGHGITDPSTQKIQEAFLQDLVGFLDGLP